MVSGLVKLRWCAGRKAFLLAMDDDAGDVLARLAGRTGWGTAFGTMFWSWERILGSNNGPCCRMGEREGVVLRVPVLTIESEGEDSKEYMEEPFEMERE